MKNRAINTLKYTGIVTLSQYIRNKKIILAKKYNKGGNPLFTFLTDCLVGDFDVARLERPSQILLLKVTENDSGTEDIQKASNSGFIYLLSKPEKVYSTSSGIVRYSFVIPSDVLADSDFNAIGLYTNSATESDFENYAALCKIDDMDKNNISISSMLVVDWELIISNKA
jgi:hypothetical protein